MDALATEYMRHGTHPAHVTKEMPPHLRFDSAQTSRDVSAGAVPTFPRTPSPHYMRESEHTERQRARSLAQTALYTARLTTTLVVDEQFSYKASSIDTLDPADDLCMLGGIKDMMKERYPHNSIMDKATEDLMYKDPKVETGLSDDCDALAVSLRANPLLEAHCSELGISNANIFTVPLGQPAAPELARANDALRRDVLSTFTAMQTEFASAMRDALARACATTTALEKEKTYQEKRNGALHARNRELYGKLQDVKGAIRVFARIRPASPGVDASDVGLREVIHEQRQWAHGEKYLVLRGACLHDALATLARVHTLGCSTR